MYTFDEIAIKYNWEKGIIQEKVFNVLNLMQGHMEYIYNGSWGQANLENMKF